MEADRDYREEEEEEEEVTGEEEEDGEPLGGDYEEEEEGSRIGTDFTDDDDDGRGPGGGGGGAGAAELTEAMRAELSAKVAELEREVDRYREATREAERAKAAHDRAARDQGSQRDAMRRWKEEEEAKLRQWKEEEEAQLRKRLAAVERRVRAARQSGPGREERKEIDALKAALVKQRVEAEAKEARWRVKTERLQKRVQVRWGVLVHAPRVCGQGGRYRGRHTDPLPRCAGAIRR